MDQLFKELLTEFLADFFRLFYPAEAARLDWSTARALGPEVFTDFPGGSARRGDLVFQVRPLGGGADEFLLLHIEVQGERRAEVRARMWEYYHLFRFRHGRAVFPVVLYLAPGAGGVVRERYTEGVLGHTLVTFEYFAVGLPDLASEDYRARTDDLAPLAAALSALMRPASRDEDRVLRKLDALRQVSAADLDETRKLVLTTVVDKGLVTTGAEEDRLQDLLLQEEGIAEDVSIYTLLREEGRQEGERIGRQQGDLMGRRALLFAALRAKFGDPPAPVVARVEAIADAGALDALMVRLLSAPSLAALGLEDAENGGAPPALSGGGQA